MSHTIPSGVVNTPSTSQSTNSLDTNSLEMTFAQWVLHMSEAQVPVPARQLAMLVAIFQVANNAELEQLSGIKDKTYDKWKRWLRDNGWVLILGNKGGRGHGIEVVPALGHAPVTLTDMNPQKVAHIKGGNNSPRPAPTQPNLVETDPKNTPVSPRAPARIEPPSEVLKPKRDSPFFPHPEADVVRLDEKGLQIFGRLREFWLEQFAKFGCDADDLDLALLDAARYVQDGSRQPLERQISSQLAGQLKLKRFQDKRYAEAAARNGKGPAVKLKGDAAKRLINAIGVRPK